MSEFSNPLYLLDVDFYKSPEDYTLTENDLDDIAKIIERRNKAIGNIYPSDRITGKGMHIVKICNLLEKVMFSRRHLQLELDAKQVEATLTYGKAE